jgi:hypothetical protein
MRFEFSRKYLQWKPKYNRNRYFGLQIKCPSFLTDSNQWHTGSRACKRSAKYKFSGKSFQLKPR